MKSVELAYEELKIQLPTNEQMGKRG